MGLFKCLAKFADMLAQIGAISIQLIVSIERRHRLKMDWDRNEEKYVTMIDNRVIVFTSG